MSIATNWGYTITDADELVPMVTGVLFNQMTANKYAGDTRTEAMTKAASMAVRNYCGWHLYPSQTCTFDGWAGVTRNITRVGCEILVQLPAKYVTAIKTVTINGIAVDSSDCLIETNGLLHVIYRAASNYEKISVGYVAGLPDALMGAVKELVANRITHALANSYGVTSEASGGVSITYNSTWAVSNGAAALADDNKEILQPYKLQGVF